MAEPVSIIKKRGLSSINARHIRHRVHDDALAFAKLINLTNYYRNDLIAKKDFLDLAGFFV